MKAVCNERPERPLLLRAGGGPRRHARGPRAVLIKLSQRIACLRASRHAPDRHPATLPSPRPARPLRPPRRCWWRPRRPTRPALTRAEPRGIVRMTTVALLDARIADVAAFMCVSAWRSTSRKPTAAWTWWAKESIAIRVRPPRWRQRPGDAGAGNAWWPPSCRRAASPRCPPICGHRLGLGLPARACVAPDRPGRHAAAIRHRPRLVTRGMLALRAAALAVGVVLPSMMVREQIAHGELIHVIPGWAPARDHPYGVRLGANCCRPCGRCWISGGLRRWTKASCRQAPWWRLQRLGCITLGGWPTHVVVRVLVSDGMRLGYCADLDPCSPPRTAASDRASPSRRGCLRSISNWCDWPWRPAPGLRQFDEGHFARMMSPPSSSRAAHVRPLACWPR